MAQGFDSLTAVVICGLSLLLNLFLFQFVFVVVFESLCRIVRRLDVICVVLPTVY